MEQKIVRDEMFLRRKSTPASAVDNAAAKDLMDTLIANQERCVGLAANMIGVRKNIIVVQTQLLPIVMLNPVIVRHPSESYEAEEGCLSLNGTRTTRRWQWVEVRYQDMQMKPHKGTFSGITAQIIQHEIDHCNGIII